MNSNMLSSKSLLTTSLFLALASSNALADSWTVTQGTTVGTDTTITQTSSSGGSVQTINGINLNGSNGTINDTSTQNVNLGSRNITLDQKSGTTNSSQAVNRASAHTINGLTQDVTITGGPKAITMNQNDSVSSSNSQAVNEAISSTETGAIINKLTQKIDGASSISLQMVQSGSSTNIQAGNLIRSSALSTTADAVTQTTNVGGTKLQQDTTTNSIQASNALIMLGGSSAAGGKIKQTFSGTFFDALGYTFKQTGVNNSIQALNYAGVTIP